FVDLSGALTRGARAASTRDRARVTRAHPTHHTRPSATSRGATRAGPNVRGRARSGAPADPDPRLVPPTLGRAHLGRRSGIDPRPRGPPATGRTRTGASRRRPVAHAPARAAGDRSHTHRREPPATGRTRTGASRRRPVRRTGAGRRRRPMVDSRGPAGRPARRDRRLASPTCRQADGRVRGPAAGRPPHGRAAVRRQPPRHSQQFQPFWRVGAHSLTAPGTSPAAPEGPIWLRGPPFGLR